MTYQFSVYSIAFGGTALMSAVAGAAAWRRHQAPGGLALFLMMMGVLIWNLAGMMEVSAVELGNQIFWSKIMYFGAHPTPPLLLLFALDYTHRRKWLTPLTITLLFLMPFLTILFAVTNEWHHLIWSVFSPSPAGANIYIFQHGPWFWMETVYINSVLFVGTFLFFQFILRSRELYRYQNVMLVIGALFPWISFIIFALNINPFPGLDITAISFAFTGTILAFTFSRLHLLDVIPVSREVLVENMIDGLLVLDQKDRIVDINPAAMGIFGGDVNEWIGRRIEELLPNHSNPLRQFDDFEHFESEWILNSPETRYFDLGISPLRNRYNTLTGKLIVFRDITSRKNSEKALHQANHQLQEKLKQIEELQAELRDRAIRDELTGLFNRRYLEEVLESELAKANRAGYSVSIAILDIDHFKEHNDVYGHLSGDKLLREIGKVLRTRFRMGDIACRYGGDEFILIMPNSSSENASRRIEELRPIFQNLSEDQVGSGRGSTFSAGIATYPANENTVEGILAAADKALYAAKTSGRNRTSFPGSFLISDSL